jgi:hypothetical protein
MSVSIEITVDQDTVTAQLDALEQFVDSPGDQLLTAATAVHDFVRQYHIEFGDRWRGDHYMAGPKSGEWQQSVVEGWQPAQLVSDTEASVINTQPHLAHKITGGTITPVQAGALTIPLVREAKGLTAAEYAASAGVELFAVKGVLAQKGESPGEIVPIYALKQSVTQAPWPGAMPPDEEISAVFTAAFQLQLDNAWAAGATA